jgi:hypothetical protein
MRLIISVHFEYDGRQFCVDLHPAEQLEDDLGHGGGRVDVGPHPDLV